MASETHPIRLTLLQFLKQARYLHFQHVAGALSSSAAPVYVLGNPSADLDSIISAIVYSYFANGHLPSSRGRPHIPLINLSGVPSGSELRRLRPEFATALWLSTNNPPATESERWDSQNVRSTGKLLNEHILTVADLKLHFDAERRPKCTLDTVMVDWNAFPIRSEDESGKRTGLLEALPNVEFRILGCIDHHVDEGGFVPSADSLPEGQPFIVQPGPGSCTSLIVCELRKRGLWAAGDATTTRLTAEAQAAKLALAAMLIDTTNLTAKGKVTGVDRLAVSFLESKIQQAEVPWDRNAFFREVQETKQNSLDLLTFPEILDRDYKEWTEEISSSKEGKGVIKLGFCSCVKPIPWIIIKATAEPDGNGETDGTPQTFLDGLRSFSASKDLDVAVIMTAFIDASTKNFRRELLLCSLHSGAGEECSRSFASRGGSEIGLSSWPPASHTADPKMREIAALLNLDSPPVWCHVWEQTDLTKSRKQVAPLLRAEAAKL